MTYQEPVLAGRLVRIENAAERIERPFGVRRRFLRAIEHSVSGNFQYDFPRSNMASGDHCQKGDKHFKRAYCYHILVGQ